MANSSYTSYPLEMQLTGENICPIASPPSRDIYTSAMCQYHLLSTMSHATAHIQGREG